MVYRKGTTLQVKEYNFLLHKGGLGDLIAQFPAIKFVLDYHPQIIVNLWVHEFIKPLAQKVFSLYTKCVIRGMNERTEINYELTSRSAYLHKITNLACHMTNHAFLTLVHTEPRDEDKNYLELEPINIDHFNLPEKYIVVTTGYTSDTRMWIPESVNEVSDYIITKGYTPVYIGKSYIPSAGSEVIIGKFNADYSKGINLIDKTDLFEAHAIMDKSKAVVGVDNGLLHLAAMSKNTKIVYGFTSVEPRHRLPYRDGIIGKDCFVVASKIGCFGCQSNMTFIDPSHDFRTCAYGPDDFLCVKSMSSALFIEQINKIL